MTHVSMKFECTLNVLHIQSSFYAITQDNFLTRLIYRLDYLSEIKLHGNIPPYSRCKTLYDATGLVAFNILKIPRIFIIAS